MQRLRADHPGRLTAEEYLQHCHVDVLTMARFLDSYMGCASARGIEILQNAGILPKRDEEVRCPFCDIGPMVTWTEVGHSVGWRFRCNNCKRRYSPTTNSFVENFRARNVYNRYGFVVHATIAWISKCMQVQVADWLRVNRETVQYWWRYFRNVAMKAALHDFEVHGVLA